MLIQEFGGMRGWRDVLAEARRVYGPAGALVAGRTVAPGDGIDEQMKQHLAAILDEIGAGSHRMNVRADALHAL